LKESPLERGASSVVKMEEAGCVKIRIAAELLHYFQKSDKIGMNKNKLGRNIAHRFL
jgi:hypothetical protein